VKSSAIMALQPDVPKRIDISINLRKYLYLVAFF
jgi:hypothetical protein